METATAGVIVAIVGSVVAAVALSVQIAALEESRRIRLTTFWKRWAWRGLLALLTTIASLGIYGFVIAPGFPTRWNVLVLLMNMLNLLSVPVFIFFDTLLEAMKTREAKRAASLAALEQKIARWTYMPVIDQTS